MHEARMYERIRWRPTLILGLVLFALWVLLSGKFDLFHLGAGILSAAAISLGTQRLLMLPPAIGPDGSHPVGSIPWLRLLWYVPWLMWQIVLASVQVAYVVLHPGLPISPRLILVRTVLPHTLARLTLATSITLTPGTVTIDVQGDEFLVHALTRNSADDLAPVTGTGSMLRRVAALYARPSAPRPTETSV